MSNIENLIANVIKRHDKKRIQLEIVRDICVHLTSDDGIWITAELYNNNICRFLIKGTRSNMTITYNTKTWELTRKPRNEKPFYTTWLSSSVYDIIRRYENLPDFIEI